MLGLRYAIGLDRARDLQDNKRSVRPRAPVWYRPKALRCLSKYGFCKVELQINRPYATLIMGLPRVLEEEVALIVGSVGWVPKATIDPILSTRPILIGRSFWEMLPYRSVTRWMERLNLGTSVHSRSEANVGGVRRANGNRGDFWRELTAIKAISGVANDNHRHFVLDQHCESSAGQQPKASTSGRGEAANGPSPCPRVSVVFPSNPRVLVGVPKEHLFGVDYLEPNKITEREIAKYRAEYLISDSIRMRIPTPTESLSKPKDGEVVFFTDVLLQGVRLPLQPAVQRILAHIRYAPGQYNPNFWVTLIGVIAVFDIAEEGEPSYEQFSYLYSITRSKSADHGGWVQANCLKASEHGHFVSSMLTSQKSWSKLKQPSPTQSKIQQIDRVRLKVPAVERVYPQFLFSTNLVKARLANPAEMTEERKVAEARRMNESSKRRLMMGLQGKKAKRQAEAVPVPQINAGTASAGVAVVSATPRRGQTTDAFSSKAEGKRPMTMDLEAEPAPKRSRQREVSRVILAAEDDGTRHSQSRSHVHRRQSNLRTT
ncbi:unnamed protein product [Prunus armeniaca]